MCMNYKELIESFGPSIVKQTFDKKKALKGALLEYFLHIAKCELFLSLAQKENEKISSS